MKNPTAEMGTVETKLPEANEPGYIERRKVGSEGIVLSTERPLEGNDEAQAEIDRLTGEHTPVIAGIRTGENPDDDDFLIVDTRGSEGYRTPYLLITAYGGQKGIWADEPLTIGRSHYKDRFQYSSHVSRNHFTITLDGETGELNVRDLESTNGTYVTGYTAGESADDTSVRGITDEYTMRADDPRLIYHDKNNVETAPYGYYMEHPVIGRNSKSVRGGVYGTSTSEWVVVNTKNETVQKTVDTVIGNLSFAPKDFGTNDYLREIERETARVLHYDLPATEDLSRPHYNKRGVIPLSEYIEAGVGVCRHQALLAGLLLEGAIDAGYLQGSIAVERNIDEDRESGHAWAVYKQEGQPDMIVDAAQHFVGTRDEAKARGLWRYVVRSNVG